MKKNKSSSFILSSFLLSSLLCISNVQAKNVGLVINAPDTEQVATNYFNPKNNPDLSSEQATLLYNFNKKVLNTIVLNSTSFAQGPFQNDAKTLYVFFDPQCKECSNLFSSLQSPEFKDYRIIWIPISAVDENNNLSLNQASTIIYSEDPLKTFKEHEESILSGKTGIKPKTDLPKSITDKIRANTYIYNHQGFTKIPALFHLSKNGQIENYQGENILDKDNLIKFINN